MKRKLSLLAAVACLCGGGYKAQAQLIISVYPSQDNPTSETLWIFSGSSTSFVFGSIRTSSTATFGSADSWQIATSDNSGNIFDANKPSDSNFQLSSLFASANTNDIGSVRARIPGGKTNITFAANATNTPTITIGSGSRTISHLFLDDDNTSDDLGIRVSGSNFSYSSGASSAWVGAGIINKPIGDFFSGTFNSGSGGRAVNFAAMSQGSVRVVVNSQVIPEPQEYALVFGLFALGFVLCRRHFQKKQRQQAATS